WPPSRTGASRFRPHLSRNLRAPRTRRTPRTPRRAPSSRPAERASSSGPYVHASTADVLQLLDDSETTGRILGERGHIEGGDPRFGEGRHPLTHIRLRADEVDRPHQLVRQRG